MGTDKIRIEIHLSEDEAAQPDTIAKDNRSVETKVKIASAIVTVIMSIGLFVYVYKALSILKNAGIF